MVATMNPEETLKQLIIKRLDETTCRCGGDDTNHLFHGQHCIRALMIWIAKEGTNGTSN